MKKSFTKFLFVFALLVGLSSMTNLSAQKKTLYLDSLDNICTTGTSISVSLRAKNFTSVLGFQGSIVWDTAILKYTSISYGSSVIALNASNMGLTSAANGNVNFLWFDNSLTPQTVADTTILFTLKFNVVKVLVGFSPVKLSNTPTKLEINEADMTGFPMTSVDAEFFSGGVGFVTNPTISKTGTTLTAVVSGTPTSYEWKLNGVTVGTGKTLTNATGSGSYTVTATYPTGCVLTSAPLLPIQLKQFSGFYKAGSANLNWTSLNDQAGVVYILQRSTNGVEFTNVIQIPSIATSSNRSNGSYTTADAIASSSKLYYRLLIKANDGSYSYSNVVVLTVNGKVGLSIYPNPVKENLSLQIQNLKDENVTVQIVDILGKVIKQQQVQLYVGANTANINVAELGRGNYLVIVKGESVQKQQFIKY